MRTSRHLLVLFAASIAMPAFGQNVTDSQTTDRETAGEEQTVVEYATVAITKPSNGHFNGGLHIRQTNGTGWGEAAEYRIRLRGANYGGLLFSHTPTNSTLYLPGQPPFSWPMRRFEFDLLWTHQFAPVRTLRTVPWVTGGVGAIALNGGSNFSGWNAQEPLVAGAGGDVRLSRRITLRVGFTMDALKASTYSDQTYRSTGTVMVEPRIGFVWGLGSPRSR